MSSHFYTKRFQRSFGPYRQSSQYIVHSNDSLRPKQEADNFGSVEKNIGLLEDQKLLIMLKLAQLQNRVKQERQERIQQNNKMSGMIKEMECKHSSIIYNSEIKYCKTPPKPQIFFSYRNLRQIQPQYNLNKAISATSLFNQGKENINNQLHFQANKTQISVCSNSKIGKKIDGDSNKLKNLENKFSNQNPEADVSGQSIQGDKSSIILLAIQNQVKLLPGLLESKLQQYFQTKTKDLYQRVQNSQAEIQKLKLDLEKQMFEETKKTITNSSQFLLNETKFQQLFAANSQRQINQIKNWLNCSMNKLQDELQSQKQQIKILSNINQLNANCSSKQMFQLQNHCNQKLNNIEKKLEINEGCQKKLIKNVEQQNFKIKIYELQRIQLNRQNISSLQQNMHRQVQLVKTNLLKELQKQCVVIEEGVVTAMEKHISYVQAYIKRTEENQETIMKKYNENQEARQKIIQTNEFFQKY